MTDKDIGQRLKVLRIRADKDVDTVANELGISPVGYRLLEKGATGLKVTRMLALCDIFGIPPEFFLSDPAPASDASMEEVYRLVGPIVGPAFDTVQAFARMATQLSEVLRHGASLKHGLDRVGIKGKRSGRRFK